MFGKSEWFAAVDNRKVLKPADQKGWTYYLIWTVVLIIPAVLINLVSGLPQALVWAGFVGIVFFLDYRKVLMTKRENEAYDRLLFIGDQEEVEAESVAETEQLEIELKR